MSGLDFHFRKRLNFPHGEGLLDVALNVPCGQWLGLLGPSGAGKTSLLRLLAGLTDAEAGHIRIDGEPWFDIPRKIVVPTRMRRIGFVFQDHALFPHMSVRRNMEFARPRGHAPGALDDLLELVGLSGLADRYPAHLSGGQQQRLALARALASNPRLLLLDEPLSALDTRLREDMQDLLLKVRRRGLVRHVLLVTHDAAEASRLVDRVVRLERGSVVADGPPECSLPGLCQHCAQALLH
jgi:molybdate transport system ATP-binding protein